MARRAEAGHIADLVDYNFIAPGQIAMHAKASDPRSSSLAGSVPTSASLCCMLFLFSHEATYALDIELDGIRLAPCRHV